MSKDKRIIDNPSSSEIIEQLQAFDSIETGGGPIELNSLGVE